VEPLLITLNYLLATAMWFILGRLFLSLFIRNPENAVWQVFLIVTEPVYRVSRILLGQRVPERWVWLVSLGWLMAARLVVTGLHNSIRS
jgi:hypothetical protein